MSKVVCIGDATIDQFFFLDEANLACDIDRENCILGLSYGDKIAVDKVGVNVGGNAANVGVGLSRLGVETSLLTTFGDDDRAVFIKRRLLEENVDLSMAKTAIGANSNLSAIIVYLGERTILTYHANVEDQIENIPVTEYIYLTSSSGRSSEKMFLKVLEFPDVKIAFNPNK